MLLVCECTEDGDDVEVLPSTVDEMGACFVLRMARPGVIRGGSSSPTGEVEREICGDHDDSATAAGGVGGRGVSVAGNCGCSVAGDVRPPPHSLRTPFMTMSVRYQRATAGDVVNRGWNASTNKPLQLRTTKSLICLQLPPSPSEQIQKKRQVHDEQPEG